MSEAAQSATSVEPVVRPGLKLRLNAWSDRTFDSLRDRNLRILWIGTLLNFAGVMMNMTAQGVVAYNLTGNSRAVGTVMLGSGISLLFIAPFAGALADRLSKRTMLITCQVILGCSFLVLGITITTGVINIPILAVGAFINGTMFAMIRSVRNAYIGELAPPEMRGNAVAVQQLAMTVMQIAGPFLAALLLGWSVTGSSGTYYVMTAAFVFAILTMFRLPATSAPKRAAGSPNVLQDALIGLKYGWSHPQIRWVLGGFFLLTLVGQPYITLLPGYTADVLDVSTSSLGVILAISAIGGFVISLVAASMADSPRAVPLLAACNLTFAASLIGLAFAPNFAAAAVVALFLGAGASGFQMLNLALALKVAENAYMGRVAALTMMASSLSGVVALPIGILADQYGLRHILFSMGIAVFIVSIVLAAWRSRAVPSLA